MTQDKIEVGKTYIHNDRTNPERKCVVKSVDQHGSIQHVGRTGKPFPGVIAERWYWVRYCDNDECVLVPERELYPL